MIQTHQIVESALVDEISTAQQPVAQTPTAARILLANNCLITRTVIIGRLLPQGHDIIEAETEKETLRYAQDAKPDLILLDAFIEDTSGLALCRKLKAIKELSEVPIIFLSNKMDRDYIVEVLEAGASDYITKPFNSREALARINTHLKIRKLIAEKTHTNETLLKVDQAKNQLLGVTSHDLRNPAYAIRGIIQFLKSEGLSKEEVKESYDQLDSAANSMIALLEDLLDFSALESGKIKLDLKRGNLSKFVEDIVAYSRQSASSKHIQLLFKHEDFAQEVSYDEKQIRRVLLNLISNAIKYSDEYSQVTVTLKKEHDQIGIFVEDEGSGIPESEQSKLFQNYSITSVKSTAGEKSTGLGLCICKKIIEAHGGTIGMENRESHGARFFFKLPLA